MKIYDLTRGKYPQMFDRRLHLDLDIDINDFHWKDFQQFFSCNKSFNDLYSLLDEVPIFLVESSMAGEYIAVPNCQCSIQVPLDKDNAVFNDDFDINNWVNSKEGNGSDDPRERITKRDTIRDLLGVYLSSDKNDVIPRKIFVWMDKIEDYTKNHTTTQKDIENNASALFELVLYHEIGHAVMDVELYGVHPAPNFSYSRDYVYRFIEEAFANAVALYAFFDQYKYSQNHFIEAFVKEQGAGYSYGFKCYKDSWEDDNFGGKPFIYFNGPDVSQWMSIKVLFNYDFALLLKKFWEHKDFHDLKYVSSVDHKGWLAVKGSDDKWGILELPRQVMVQGFNRYDDIGKFLDHGLCWVRNGEARGYINKDGKEQIPVEYDFIYIENGVTIAQKNGKYGIIDLNNNILVPFELPYVYCDSFRNGRANVQDSNGKWGVIDTKGNLIVPCTSDKRVE